MKNLTKQRTLALGTLAVMSATILGGSAVAPVQAKSSTWKKIAIGSGVVTGYGLLKGNKKVAIIGGLATAGSYYKYKKDKKNESRRYRTTRRSARYYRR
ncbi:hypothetical protein B1R32_11165 [Abditibacterium utsteinense]|uniref:Uncharacterized protein n=1 Tax=Abditibacterium utsteinense TaxID=1960156 RepID=A0A2S8SRS1_9BACT|nr:hypothetical protein [Abditibacterium utsteinense]PQV63504.1 hypothetical protein B1R32_11165 [Abditibacterium utsteinense]